MSFLPALYKRTNTGAIQQWSVDVLDGKDAGVVTKYGQLGGQIQTTTDIIKKGKNLGKKNETTPYQQSLKQAQQQWEKKKKQGYSESLEVAESTDNMLEAIKPMLAHTYQEHLDKVTWPAYVQPKLDGMRCIAIIENGTCKLYSRTQKPINTVPHINRALEQVYGYVSTRMILDGELYNHKMKDDFNKIMSLSKRKELHPDHELIQYHVYDIPSLSPPYVFSSRAAMLGGMIEHVFERAPSNCIQVVQTHLVQNEEELMEYFYNHLDNGYEGAMYRKFDSHYEGKRTASLLKLKPFGDDQLALEEDFETLEVVEGRGKRRGRVGSIWCKTKDGKRFKANMEGSMEVLKEYFENFETKYKGKLLSVKFQNWTPRGVPRIPIGIRFKEEE